MWNYTLAACTSKECVGGRLVDSKVTGSNKGLTSQMSSPLLPFCVAAQADPLVPRLS